MNNNRLHFCMPHIRRSGLEHMLACCGIWALLFAAFFSLSKAYGQISEDLDSDGVADIIDIDQDNDGIINTLEGVVRLTDLSNSPANYFAASPADTTSRGMSFSYDLVSLDNGLAATLVGTVLSSDTEVEWSTIDALPRLRNLRSGNSVVQWNLTGESAVSNIDLTISDLDGLRSETVSVHEPSIVGYSLALNSNVVVQRRNGQLSFTGTGAGGESEDDLVTLHFRDASAIVISYSNQLSEVGRDNSIADMEMAELGIAGYRHSLEFHSSTYFTPVTQYRDSDADGVADHRDLDSDNDGLGDLIESGGVDADHDNLSDGAVGETGLSINAVPGLNAESVSSVYIANDATVVGDDEDGDGLLSSVDGNPKEFGGSLSNSDLDDDGLNDLDEVRIYLTNPNQADSDNDGLDDGAEVDRYHTNPLQSDSDLDGLTDGDEVNQHGTMPGNDDSDGDGVSDSEEIRNATDPLVSDRIIVVLQDPVLVTPAPETLIEMPVQVIEEPGVEDVAVPTLGEPEDTAEGPDIPTDDAVSLLVDDPIQSNEVSLRTGLGGRAGCTVVGKSGSSAAFLPIILVLAIGGLANSSRRRKYRV